MNQKELYITLKLIESFYQMCNLYRCYLLPQFIAIEVRYLFIKCMYKGCHIKKYKYTLMMMIKHVNKQYVNIATEYKNIIDNKDVFFITPYLTDFTVRHLVYDNISTKEIIRRFLSSTTAAYLIRFWFHRSKHLTMSKWIAK
jgi:hypothetical protein